MEPIAQDSRLRPAFGAAQIRSAVHRLAARLSDELAADPAPPTFIVILKGGARFACDLLRAYSGEYRYEFIGIESYREAAAPQGEPRFYLFRPEPGLLEGRSVVLVDDICDSGATFRAATGRIGREFHPRRVLTCALLLRQGAAFTPDCWALEAPGEAFLVGYGLGLGERWRHLEGLYTLESERASDDNCG